MTSLHYACHNAQYNYTTRMIRLLLNKGADPNIKATDGQQATDVMENYDRLDMEIMRELKADINELLEEGVDNPSCFIQAFKCFRSFASKAMSEWLHSLYAHTKEICQRLIKLDIILEEIIVKSF